jgi:hypothetical protein
MRAVLRWLFIAVVAIHGLIHLMGAAKGLGLADVDQLSEPVSAPMGLLWLVAAVGVLATAVMVMLRSRWWWFASAAAAVVSQTVILTSWDDAKAGTVVNVVMLLAAGYGYAAEGPPSLRAEYRRRVAAALGHSPAGATLTDLDLLTLPASAAEYVRRSGAVGRPRVTGFRATLSGRIRSGPERPWMAFTGEQVNYYGPNPTRLFFIDATRSGLPVDIFHCFADHAATMRGRLASVLPIVSAAGPDMTRAETVTLFNDICFLAPGALVDAPVSWESVDDHRVRARYTVGEHTVCAELEFNDDGDLVDFISEDRLRMSADGKSLTPMPWSTPLGTTRCGAATGSPPTGRQCGTRPVLWDGSPMPSCMSTTSSTTRSRGEAHPSPRPVSGLGRRGSGALPTPNEWLQTGSRAARKSWVRDVDVDDVVALVAEVGVPVDSSEESSHDDEREDHEYGDGHTDFGRRVQAPDGESRHQ